MLVVAVMVMAAVVVCLFICLFVVAAAADDDNDMCICAHSISTRCLLLTHPTTTRTTVGAAQANLKRLKNHVQRCPNV
jgi:hypothetical protein